jgi:hypothetical protein
MSNSQYDNPKNERHKVGDEYVSMNYDKASIHSTSDGARHMEGAQEKEFKLTEGRDRGSWQINEKLES